MRLEPTDPDRHHSLTYPMEIGAPKFELVPIKQQKDLMINAARLYAKQEYDRIMELVAVLQKQAQEIKDRLDLTDQIHAAEYKFQLFAGSLYWLLYDTILQNTRLIQQGPNDWSCGKPDHYEYITQVQWLGDQTWIEIKNDETK